MSKERRLGRGLEALLGRVGGVNEENEQQVLNLVTAPTDEPDWALQEKLKDQPVAKIEVAKIEANPFQPRLEFNETELEQLSQSLIAHGLLQPIIVRQVGAKYQIIAGERRFRAALRAGWNQVPVHLLAVDDRQMVELALTENVQRKDLNAIEKAIAFTNYLHIYGGTHEELAKRLELDRSTVTNLLRLLDLPQRLQDAVRQEQLSTGHVRALLPLKEEYLQNDVAEKIIAEGWNVRETERFVQELLQTGEATSPKDSGWNVVDSDGRTLPVSKTTKSEHLVQLEQDFRNKLGCANIQLSQTNEKGKGKLVITFANHQEFEQIYSAICKTNRAAG